MASLAVHILPAINAVTIIVISLVALTSAQKQRYIRIGGLFETEQMQQEIAFKYAVDKVNRNADILPGILLNAEVRQVVTHDSFNASKEACSILSAGVAGIMGPMSTESSAHVRSICHYLDVPHLQTRWTSDSSLGFYSLNVFPDHETLSAAYIALIQLFKWERFTLIYETDDGLIRLQNLLNKDNTNAIITVYQLPADGKYSDMLEKIRRSKANRLVVDCSIKLIKPLLIQAKPMEMVTNAYHYLFTTLDLGILDFTDFRSEGANITAYRLVDPDDLEVTRIVSDWVIEESGSSIAILQGNKGITTESALIFDAVFLLARALHNASMTGDMTPRKLSCTSTGPTAQWAQGNTLINAMRMVKFNGLTGPVSLDPTTGRRKNVRLELEEVQPYGHTKRIGEWNPSEGLLLTKTYKDTLKNTLMLMKNITLNVVTKDDKPFVFFNETDEDGRPLIGNARFTGFCIDLLYEIKDVCLKYGWGRLNFKIHRVKDGQYGIPSDSDDPKGSPWNGMVGELMRGEADLAMASLTITYIREQVIDFSKPFWNLGISIIYKRAQEKNPDLFSFLSPLSITVWMYMIAAYLLISFMLFVLARFSPYEWVNPNSCSGESDTLENQFGLLNSLWFTIGSLMQQGSDLAPQATSTRMLAGFWWFFTLIMISSYTANLAAFLTVERMATPIENAQDLARQTKIKYGTLKSGSTYSFFKDSEIATYKTMYNFMISQHDSFVNDTSEGIAKVENEDYAFLLESTMNEYFTERKCDLMPIGNYLDSKGYGVGLQQNSIYRDMISDAILKLQEMQKIQILYNKWWRESGGAGNCMKKSSSANELGVKNVGGVFVVLLMGAILSAFVGIIEFVWKARKRASKDQQQFTPDGRMVEKEPLCREMWSELKFALNCVGSSKRPVHRIRAEMKSTNRNSRNAEDVGFEEAYNAVQIPLNGMSFSSQNLAKHKRTLEREIYA